MDRVVLRWLQQDKSLAGNLAWMDAVCWQAFAIICRRIQVVDFGPDMTILDVQRKATDVVIRNWHKPAPVTIPLPGYEVLYMNELECAQLVMSTAKGHGRISRSLS